MEAIIDNSYLSFLGFNVSNLYLNDHNCRPIITANGVEFKIPLNQCGTVQQVNKIDLEDWLHKKDVFQYSRQYSCKTIYKYFISSFNFFLVKYFVKQHMQLLTFGCSTGYGFGMAYLLSVYGETL